MTKNLTFGDICVGLGFVGLLIGTAYIQTKLKDNPQITMLVFSGLTLLTYLMKQDKIGTALFYLLLGTMLYINYFLITNWILDVANPE